MSLLSDANQAGLDARKRQAVQLYSPNAPTARPPAPPPLQGKPSSNTKWAEMAARMAPPAQEEEDEGSKFGRGLGYLVNNPLTQTALKPLEYADYLRRMTTLGVETAATNLPGVLEPIVPLAPFIDEDKVALDERDWKEKLKDPEYGFGQVTGETGNKWLDRGIGLAGDIALDPLTYVAGIGLAGKAGKAGSVAGKAANSAALVKALDKGIDASRLAKIGRRGFGFADDDILRAAEVRGGIRVGLSPSKSVTIPGSEKLTQPLSKARGVIAGKARETKLGGKIMDMRSPKTLEDAYNAIYRGQGPLSNDIDTALQRVGVENAKRAAQGAFSMIARTQAEGLIKEIRKASDSEQRLILRDVESALEGVAPKTALGKKYAKQLEDLRLQAKEAGVEIKKRRAYSPRILTRDAVKALRDDPEEARRMSGLITVDLYDPSGVTMSRKIRKGSEVTVKGQKVTITDDTIDGINKTFREAGLDFDFYESNPGVVLEKYINMLSSDVGWAKAMKQRADKLPKGKLRNIEKEAAFARLTKDDPLKAGERSIVDEVTPDIPNTLIRGSGKVDPQADLETLGQRLGVDFDSDVFEAEKAIENRPILSTKGKTKGEPKLTTDGRAKVEAVDLTSEFNEKVAGNIRQHRENARRSRLVLRQQLEGDVRSGKGKLLLALRQQVDDSVALFGVLNEQRKAAIKLIKDSGRFPAAQVDAGARNLDLLFKELDDDVRFLNAALERAGGNRALRQRVDKLTREVRNAKKELTDIGQRKVRGVNNEIANIASRREALRAPVAEAKAKLDEVTRAARVEHGADDAIREHMKINAKMDGLRKTVRDPDVAPGIKKVAANELKKLDKEYQAALAKSRAAVRKVQADPAVKKAKSDLAAAELRQARTPYAGQTPNVGVLDEPERQALRKKMAQIKNRVDRINERKAAAIKAKNEGAVRALGPEHFDAQLERAAKELDFYQEKLSALRPKTVPSAEDALRQRELSLGSRVPEDAADVVRNIDTVQSKTGEIKDIVRNPAAAKTENKRDMLARQAETRVASMKARSGAAQLDVIAKNKEASMRMRKASQERLRALNAETLADNAKYTAGTYPDEVQGRLRELKEIIDADEAGAIPHDVAVQVEHELNKALDLLEEVKKADLDLEQLTKNLKTANSNDIGRVVRAKLHEEWSLAGKEFGVEGLAIHDDLAQSLRQVKDASYHKDFWPVVDTFTNLFKTYATLTPGFHVRNAMSAVFMNSSDGVPIKIQAEGARLWAQFRRADDPAKWLAKQKPEIQQAFEAAGGSGIGGRFFERGVGDRTTLRYKSMEKAFDNPLTRKLGHGLGGSVEGAVRLPVALHTIRGGGSVDDALARVTRLHFDYSQVSRFDEAAKRMIPFWTFMSRNLPLQITQMWTQPRTYAKYRSFIRNARTDDEPNTPEYWDALGAFNTGEKLGGLPLYLQPDFAHTRLDEDIANIENFVSGENMLRPLSDFNPLFTAPAEFATGKNFFTGREYQEDDLRKTGGLEKPIGALGKALGLNEGPDGELTPEKFIDMFRSMVPLYDRSARLAPGVTSGSKSEDQNARQLESWLRFLGAPVRQLSPQQQKAAQQSERYEKLDEKRMEAAIRRLLAEQP